MALCSRCSLRTLRRLAQTEKLKETPLYGIVHSRAYASASAQQNRSEDSQPETTIPITAGTVTSNITAPTPPSLSSQQDTTKKSSKFPSSAFKNGPQPTTAQMQRAIQSSIQANSLTHKLAASLRRTAKSTTQSYITYGLTEALFKSCAAQAPYTIAEDLRMGIYTGKGPPKNSRDEDVGIPERKDSWWFNELGLEPTFSTWSQVTFLHMYICTVKLRTLEKHRDFLDYQRYLLEHFSNAAEDKMALLHGMNARGVRNKYLKDLFVQWRGVLYAYDQGLVQGDAVLGAAVWRNLWKASNGVPSDTKKKGQELTDFEPEDVDWDKVAKVVCFIRRSIAGLAEVDIQEMAAGLQSEKSRFWEEARLSLEGTVGIASKGMKEPLIQEQRQNAATLGDHSG